MIEDTPTKARNRLGLFFYDGSFLVTFPGRTYTFCYGMTCAVSIL